MNGKELLEAMNFVDEKYIAEAEKKPVRHFHWQPLAAAAACLALVMVGVRVAQPSKKVFMEVAAPQEYQRSMEFATEAAAGFAEDAVEEAVGNAAPMMASFLAEMTVQVVERTETELVCIVLDPGTGNYAADAQVRIALPETADEAAAKKPGGIYHVTYAPTDSDRIEAIEMSLEEKE